MNYVSDEQKIIQKGWGKRKKPFECSVYTVLHFEPSTLTALGLVGGGEITANES